jgi:hypothetical protein
VPELPREHAFTHGADEEMNGDEQRQSEAQRSIVARFRARAL